MFTKTHSFIAALLLSVLPFVSAAQTLAEGGTGNNLAIFFRNLIQFINGVIIPAILALAFLVFVWGVFKYFVAGGANDDAKEKGKSLMLYATAGFVVILIFFGIVNLLVSSIGLGGATLPAVPTLPLP